MNDSDRMTPPERRGPALSVGDVHNVGTGGSVGVTGMADRWQGTVELRRGTDALDYGSFLLDGIDPDRSYSVASTERLQIAVRPEGDSGLRVQWTSRAAWGAGQADALTYDSEAAEAADAALV